MNSHQPILAGSFALAIAVALATACGGTTVRPDGQGGGGDATGGGGEGLGGEGGCDGATCLGDEVCGYDPENGCGAKRVCASVVGANPNCTPGWHACACDNSVQVEIHCPDGLTDVPTGWGGSCPPL